ncbi:VOC family protein [Aquimarina sp. MMG016]|uniref:VOC family protein n=1 Tax=Aquimarina sp. MMG016 TaxID=2822690 RepID=UPI001B39DD6C|nr:VOC family protein [Aquimarina sp. MMG016]MBQ4820345.1 VOC family protein [Aquimarina sp. MMG016]
MNSENEEKSLVNLGGLSLKTVVRTKDYNASRDFYHQILNLKIVEEYSSENRGCVFRFGHKDNNAFIEISEIKEGHYYYNSSFSKEVANDKIDLQLKTTDIMRWVNHLEGKWETIGPVDRPWGSRYLYLRDPDGLQIIIYEEKEI